MARFSLDDVLASVLNSDDENDECGLLDSSSENEEGQESSEVVACSVESRNSQVPFAVILRTIGPIVTVFIVLVTIILFVTIKKKVTQTSKDRELLHMGRKESMVPMAYIPPEPGSEIRAPIAFKLLAAHVENMHLNENCGFGDEYRIIQDKSPEKPATTGLLAVNGPRNRYYNIKCFEETRVKLTPEDETSNDYINANFIKGYNHPKEYIASQGPLANTIADFWQMVWEYDVPTVVMLTNLVEKMKNKCSQYWPDSGSATYGNYVVTHSNTISLADFVIRDFKIQRKDDEETKIVRQFHFISWPDFGVPRHATPLLYFLRRLRAFHKYSDTRPIIFHCSAGVGRTGTLITIDVELQRAEKEDCVDPFNLVRELREQRNHMVQAEAQYIFLHDAILEGAQSGKTEVSANELCKQMELLKETNLEGESGFKEEFELLRQFKVDVREFSVASDDKNKFKNRVTNALPYNYNRVNLQMKPGISGSDYINASFLDGYTKKAAYIATQDPLLNTVEDFCRMIWERSVNVVVMLTQLTEGEEECTRYWPVDKETTEELGDFTVKLLDVDTYEDYMTRELMMVEKKSGSMRIVKQFHFTAWPDYGAPVPGVGLVDLIDQVTRRQQQTGDNHVVVHCNAGVGRTGAFCCVSIAIEQVQAEGVVDIFHNIKHLRTQRAHMIQNEAQYIFCYRAILDYVESLNNYSNLK